MKVFMLGWEFPPFISGGLGTACHGLTRGLDEIGVDVVFVLPRTLPHDATSHVSFRTPASLNGPSGTVSPSPGEESVEQGSHEEPFEHVTVKSVPAAMQPYAQPETTYEQAVERLSRLRQSEAVRRAGAAAGIPVGSFLPDIGGGEYSGDLLGQVQRYAALAVELASEEPFDVIHAHDWMTYPAGLAVAAYTGKPLVVHVHSTEFDRSGDHVHQQVYDIERAGMHAASRVICVSHLTRGIVLRRYAVPPERVTVVYNAVETPGVREIEMPPIRRDEKIVLFLGRVTMQKGPEYFLQAAKKVLQKYNQKVRFVMAGSGDLINRSIELAAELGIGRHVTFTGFLRGDNVAKIFRMADLYVMPSVSEPFGIAPLEALTHNVPVIISKQSGVSEVLTHVLKVDFWDVDEMANKILAVLRHPPLQRVLRTQAHMELNKFSWRDSAEECGKVYKEVAAGG
jgi:glycosyltransferase involved in cell wall biosynthesis